MDGKVLGYNQLKSNNLVEQVFETLKEDILSGKIKIGEKLPRQEELAAQFGVSRPVIREAQNKLSSIGLVDSQQGRGTFVCQSKTNELIDSLMHKFTADSHDFKELLEVRLLLEGAIIKLAATKMSEKTLGKLQHNVDEMAKSIKKNDVIQFAHYDMSFHKEIAISTQNSILLQLFDSIFKIGRNFIRLHCDSKVIMSNGYKYHQQIIDALRKNDFEFAETLMNQHIVETFEITN
jgi:GntR family transcriptional regulator, transcriptional repressor for pyruvate dehydrogenase complex